jgi:hypothetical protein
MLQLYGHDVGPAVDFYGCAYSVAVLGQVPLAFLLDPSVLVAVGFAR